MDISVIIPVFNAASYIRRCVESVIAFPNVHEIIIIDDGSSDGSDGICDQLATEHLDLIRVIHQQNRGVSAARNLGICVAHGEWLWFVDADDYVLPVDERLCCISESSDFVLTGFVWDENQQVQTCGASTEDVPYNLWRCWFKRSLINEFGLFFTLGRRYAEDQEFIIRYLMSVGRDCVAAIPAPCYYYTLRPGSAMTRSGMKKVQAKDLLSVIWRLLRESLRNGEIKKAWLQHELKRLLKNLYVTIIK